MRVCLAIAGIILFCSGHGFIGLIFVLVAIFA